MIEIQHQVVPAPVVWVDIGSDVDNDGYGVRLHRFGNFVRVGYGSNRADRCSTMEEMFYCAFEADRSDAIEFARGILEMFGEK